jgi:hypothetical protein
MTEQVDIKIAHGDPEEDYEVQALQRVRDAAEPWWLRTLGTNDTTAYRIRREGLEPMLALINEIKCPWWRVTVTVVQTDDNPNEADLKAAISRHPANFHPHLRGI